MPPAQHNQTARGISAPASRRSATCLGLVAGTVTLFTIAACGGSSVDAQSGSPPSATGRPTTSPTPRASERTIAADAAVSQVRKYESVLDELSIHPRLSLDVLNTVATEPDLAAEIGSLNQFRNAKDRIEGRTQVTSVQVDGVRLPNQVGRRDDLPTVKVSICLYVAGVRASDSSGRSIVTKSRKPYFLTHLTLVNPRYPKAAGWLVRNRTDREVDRCAL